MRVCVCECACSFPPYRWARKSGAEKQKADTKDTHSPQGDCMHRRHPHEVIDREDDHRKKLDNVQTGRGLGEADLVGAGGVGAGNTNGVRARLWVELEV